MVTVFRSGVLKYLCDRVRKNGDLNLALSSAIYYIIVIDYNPVRNEKFEFANVVIASKRDAHAPVKLRFIGERHAGVRDNATEFGR